MNIDTFTRAYLIAALFTEDPEPRSGEFYEHDDWTIENIAEESLKRAVTDCALFQSENGHLIAEDIEHAGRDFWYTRNGHGCGFWDGDWPEAVGERLTDSAKQFPEVDLYRGDDGQIYID